MNLDWKVTVKPNNVAPEIILAIMMVESVFSKHGYYCTITSLNDSYHGHNSLHFSGKAVDFRTKELPTEEKHNVVREIVIKLISHGYDVVFEDEGEPNEHLHVEWDPK